MAIEAKIMACGKDCWLSSKKEEKGSNVIK
jgi:hypothetical protein